MEEKAAEADDADEIDEGAANLLAQARKAFAKKHKSTTSVTEVDSDISFSDSNEEDDNDPPHQDASSMGPEVELPTAEVIKIVLEDYVVDVAYHWSKEARHPDVVAKKFERTIAKHARKAVAREKRRRAHDSFTADEEADAQHVPCVDEENSVEPPTSAPKDKGKGAAAVDELPSAGENEQDHDPKAAHATNDPEDDDVRHEQDDDDDDSEFEANVKHSASRGDTNRQLRSERRVAEGKTHTSAAVLTMLICFQLMRNPALGTRVRIHLIAYRPLVVNSLVANHLAVNHLAADLLAAVLLVVALLAVSVFAASLPAVLLETWLAPSHHFHAFILRHVACRRTH